MTDGNKLLATAFGTAKKAQQIWTAFQKLLAYRSWLRKKEFRKLDNPTSKSEAKNAIIRCLKYLK